MFYEIGALIIGIGFWGIVKVVVRNPVNNVGNCLGFYFEAR